jgi:hypothetical protein
MRDQIEAFPVGTINGFADLASCTSGAPLCSSRQLHVMGLVRTLDTIQPFAFDCFSNHEKWLARVRGLQCFKQLVLGMPINTPDFPTKRTESTMNLFYAPERQAPIISEAIRIDYRY